MQIGYVNIFVSDFSPAVDFFSETLGLKLAMREDNFGYASFDGGSIGFAIAETEDSSLVGKHTGIGFIVEDIDKAYEEMKANGVEFDTPPTKQPGARRALRTARNPSPGVAIRERYCCEGGPKHRGEPASLIAHLCRCRDTMQPPRGLRI